jgi:hypothetical protein
LAYWNSEYQSFRISEKYSSVSTGLIGRFNYYETPKGWFEQLPENAGWRSQGIPGEKYGLRGYGKKDLRIWDFGWQESSGYWNEKFQKRKIRLAMHSINKKVLEPLLGEKASRGCVRIHSNANEFIDNNSILDNNLFKSNISWLLKRKTKTSDSGSFILII